MKCGTCGCDIDFEFHQRRFLGGWVGTSKCPSCKRRTRVSGYKTRKSATAALMNKARKKK